MSTRIVGITDPASSSDTATKNYVDTTGFGADTEIDLLNNASALVKALELISTLTTTTAGAEASNWVIKTLIAGAQVISAQLSGDRALFPTGNVGSAIAGVGFTGVAAGNGIAYDSGNGALGFLSGGAYRALFNGDQFWMLGGLANIQLNDSTLGRIGPDGAIQLATGGKDMVMGTSTALATNATQGFLQIPTCAGVPTGTIANLRTGHVALVFNSTTHKLYANDGSGWVLAN